MAGSGWREIVQGGGRLVSLKPEPYDRPAPGPRSAEEKDFSAQDPGWAVELMPRWLDRFLNTEPAVAAIRLITVPVGCSKTIEIPLPPLLVPIKRL